MISPLARRLRLGAAIRSLREEAGLTGVELAKKADVDRTAVSKVENGERKPLDPLLRILDALLPETDERYRVLMRVARDGLARGWWENSTYSGMGERQTRTADLESGVYSIRTYQNSMLPGLLQTESYARHRAEVAMADGAELDIEGTTAGRLRRQELIADSAIYDVVVEPQAIRRPPVPAVVMREQLVYLLNLAARPNVRVRVLPVDARLGGGYVPRSPFDIYTYPDPDDLTLVAVDTVSADLLVTAPAESGRYAQMFDQLRDAALDEQASAAFIQAAADEVAGA